jgi:hypothetical protein
VIRRREFITLLGGAAAWPISVRAQQPERMRRIGIFMPGTADNSEFQDRNVAFLQGLAEKGWALGRNARLSLGGGPDRAVPSICGGARRSRSRCHSRQRNGYGESAATGDAQCADRVR